MHGIETEDVSLIRPIARAYPSFTEGDHIPTLRALNLARQAPPWWQRPWPERDPSLRLL